MSVMRGGALAGGGFGAAVKDAALAAGVALVLAVPLAGVAIDDSEASRVRVVFRFEWVAWGVGAVFLGLSNILGDFFARLGSLCGVLRAFGLAVFSGFGDGGSRAFAGVRHFFARALLCVGYFFGKGGFFILGFFIG